MTCLLADGVRLALVLVYGRECSDDDIRADGSTENGRQRVGVASGRAILADDADGGRGHCENRICWCHGN